MSVEGNLGNRLAYTAGAIAIFIRLPDKIDNYSSGRGSALFVRQAIFISEKNRNLPIALFAPGGGERSYLMIEHRNTDSLGKKTIYVTEEHF